jgi:2,4-diketo-3-deoxy-L-fuconate hydrolase
MKLLRVGEAGREKPAVLIDGRAYDVSQVTTDFDGAFFADDGLDRLRRRLAGGIDGLPELDPSARAGAPIARPGQVWCIGVNYRDHAAESSIPVPDEPIVFGKAAFSVIGPDDDVHIPRGSVKTDWEVELGVVIGKAARYLQTDEEAIGCIAGVAISHDVSEREWQLEHAGEWIKGKSFETFNPLGPWLVTLDEIGDLAALRLELDVNGDAQQRGSTAEMVFGVAQLVRYLSQFTVLQPGDLVNTGTPAGVGLGRTPPRYLAAGDVVALRIPGLGAQRQRFVAAP